MFSEAYTEHSVTDNGDLDRVPSVFRNTVKICSDFFSFLREINDFIRDCKNVKTEYCHLLK